MKAETHYRTRDGKLHATEAKARHAADISYGNELSAICREIIACRVPQKAVFRLNDAVESGRIQALLDLYRDQTPHEN